MNEVVYEGVNLSVESMKELKLMCGVLCDGTNLDPLKVFEEGITNVSKKY